MNRVFQFLLCGISFLILHACSGSKNLSGQGTISGWQQLPDIKKNIKTTSFPKVDFNILNYGAVGDGTTNCLPAIKKALSACSEKGGGRVIIPKGHYFVKGPIHLENNVNLHLEEGSVLKFSTDDRDYLPLVLTRYEGMELMNYSPLIYAYGKHNIAVTGKGILDGQANNEHWWPWVGSKRFGWKEGMPSKEDPGNLPKLAEMAKSGIPVKERIFGEGHYLRPTFLEVYNCDKVLIEGITLINAPFWILHPTLSRDVIIDGVTFDSHGPNNDGCDPESSYNVWIKNCTFHNGDDCIAIKSGRDEDGRRVNVPSKNIIIENSLMKDGHGGVVIGSEASGGVENVFAQDCKMNSPQLDRAIRIKTNACRGGVLKNLYFRNIAVGEVKEAVVKINMFYDIYGREKKEKCHFIPTLDGVYIDHVTSQKSEYALNLRGRTEKPIKNVVILNSTFNNTKKENVVENVQDLKIENTSFNK